MFCFAIINHRGDYPQDAPPGKNRAESECGKQKSGRELDMAKPWARAFYNSTAWIRARDLYIQERMMKDGGLCEECHREPGAIVHHRIHLTEENVNDFEISLSLNNFEYVCKACHDSFEGHGAGGHGKAAALCTFDQGGHPISLREIDKGRGLAGRETAIPPMEG